MSSARLGIAIRLLAVAVLSALTAGCFQPMYAEHADGTGLRDKLLTVDLPPVDKPNASHEARIQVAIRNALAFKLYGAAVGSPPLYRLDIKFSTTRSSLIVNLNTGLPDTETFGIDAQYNLVELATNKSVMTGTTFSHLSYDIPGSYQRFARARAIRDAEDRSAEEIADHIKTRLASYFFTATANAEAQAAAGTGPDVGPAARPKSAN
jgi:LPS-assembly lipoprotein